VPKVKYDPTTTLELQQAYLEGIEDANIVNKLSLRFDVPERSIIAKLSSLGIYQKKTYLNKRGEPPVKKEEYIERIAEAMEVNLELLESLEKANKNVLILILKALSMDIAD
jgi:Zn-dependent peptidase ImmA (M78 family)